MTAELAYGVPDLEPPAGLREVGAGGGRAGGADAAGSAPHPSHRSAGRRRGPVARPAAQPVDGRRSGPAVRRRAGRWRALLAAAGTGRGLRRGDLAGDPPGRPGARGPGRRGPDRDAHRPGRHRRHRGGPRRRRRRGHRRAAAEPRPGHRLRAVGRAGRRRRAAAAGQLPGHRGRAALVPGAAGPAGRRLPGAGDQRGAGRQHPDAADPRPRPRRPPLRATGHLTPTPDSHSTPHRPRRARPLHLTARGAPDR